MSKNRTQTKCFVQSDLNLKNHYCPTQRLDWGGEYPVNGIFHLNIDNGKSQELSVQWNT